MRERSALYVGAAYEHSLQFRFSIAALVGVAPLALYAPNPATDFLLSLALTAHIHWGMEAIAVDYVRARVVGNFLPKV